MECLMQRCLDANGVYLHLFSWYPDTFYTKKCKSAENFVKTSSLSLELWTIVKIFLKSYNVSGSGICGRNIAVGSKLSREDKRFQIFFQSNQVLGMTFFGLKLNNELFVKIIQNWKKKNLYLVIRKLPI